MSIICTGVTFSFIWVSITSYTAIAVPSVSLATVQGLVHGVYFGLGNGLGHLIGGLLIGNYGAVATFYSFAVATAVWLLFFALCQKVAYLNYTSLQRMDKEYGMLMTTMITTTMTTTMAHDDKIVVQRNKAKNHNYFMS